MKTECLKFLDPGKQITFKNQITRYDCIYNHTGPIPLDVFLYVNINNENKITKILRT